MRPFEYRSITRKLNNCNTFYEIFSTIFPLKEACSLAVAPILPSPASLGPQGVLRKKFKIEKGTRITIYDDGKRIIVEPIHDDPVAAGKGILKTHGKVLKALIADREKESER